jgi:hypothetical protein
MGFIGSENPIRRLCVRGFFLPSAKMLRQQRGHRNRSVRFLRLRFAEVASDPAAAWPEICVA